MNWVYYKEGSKYRQVVDLPHDAMIVEQRDPESLSGSAGAYFPGGIYIYEKTFDVPHDWSDKHILFEFEGVYQNSKVYINGLEAGGYPYGYMPFTVCADGFLEYGKENIIRVVADNSKIPNSRWYTGGGIYRPVWMYVTNKEHIKHEGVKISTLSYKPARIRVETAHTGGNINVEILYHDQVVAKGQGDNLELEIPDAKLWSDETPELYQCRVSLISGDTVVDEVVETFGIRKVEWSPQGLFINGKETLLRGGCVHHDNGILGARSFAESEERRVRIMKEAGYNAIRSAHNPASKAMLKACDKYGVYMIDELWDMWYFHKSKHDYASHFMHWYKEDIKALISRDFNHPSVIMYSIGNEVSEPKDEKGVNLAKEMVELIHSLDPNRAVTCGVNLMIINMASKGKGIYKEEGGLAKEEPEKQKATSSTLFNMLTYMVGTGMNKAGNSKSADRVTSPLFEQLDIAGYNYASGRYPLDGKKHPERIVLGTETFPQDIAKNWAMIKKYPYLIGDFMWTAWDYIGEAGIGAWTYTPDGKRFNKPYPWLLADVGAIDILGNIGAQAAYAGIVWGTRKEPYIGVCPVNHPGKSPYKSVWRGTNAIDSWAWKNCEGNKAIVEVYADAARVELLLNGKSLGKKRIKNYKAIFKTKYAPGTLMAIAYDANGREIGRTQLSSATGRTQILVQPEKDKVSVDEIVYVNVSLVGENGVVESNADQKLHVSVEGGELLAFGSANPCTEEQYHTGTFTTYYGRAQAVVRAKKAGILKVYVSGEGQTTKKASVVVKPKED